MIKRSIPPTTVVGIVGGVILLQTAFVLEPDTPAIPALVYACLWCIMPAMVWMRHLYVNERLADTQSVSLRFALLTVLLTTLLRAIEASSWADGSRVLTPDNFPAWYSAFLLATMARPLCEEGLLRAYLLPRLRVLTSDRDAIFTLAVAGVFAGGSVTHTVSNAILGALLTMLAMRTGSLWLSCITHVAAAGLAPLADTALSPVGPRSMPILLALPLIAGIAFGLHRVSRSWHPGKGRVPL